MITSREFRFFSAFIFLSQLALAQDAVVLHIGTLIHGKGGVQRNTCVVVKGSKVEKIGGREPGQTIELKNYTLLPGLIDTHVHIGWHFGPDGRYQQRDTSPASAMGYAMENAYVTLMGGFTTVQSVGAPIDDNLRTAINRGVLPDLEC